MPRRCWRPLSGDEERGDAESASPRPRPRSSRSPQRFGSHPRGRLAPSRDPQKRRRTADAPARETKPARLRRSPVGLPAAATSSRGDEPQTAIAPAAARAPPSECRRHRPALRRVCDGLPFRMRPGALIGVGSAGLCGRGLHVRTRRTCDDAYRPDVHPRMRRSMALSRGRASSPRRSGRSRRDRAGEIQLRPARARRGSWLRREGPICTKSIDGPMRSRPAEPRERRALRAAARASGERSDAPPREGRAASRGPAENRARRLHPRSREEMHRIVAGLSWSQAVREAPVGRPAASPRALPRPGARSRRTTRPPRSAAPAAARSRSATAGTRSPPHRTRSADGSHRRPPERSPRGRAGRRGSRRAPRVREGAPRSSCRAPDRASRRRPDPRARSGRRDRQAARPPPTSRLRGRGRGSPRRRRRRSERGGGRTSPRPTGRARSRRRRARGPSRRRPSSGSPHRGGTEDRCTSRPTAGCRMVAAGRAGTAARAAEGVSADGEVE